MNKMEKSIVDNIKHTSSVRSFGWRVSDSYKRELLGFIWNKFASLSDFGALLSHPCVSEHAICSDFFFGERPISSCIRFRHGWVYANILYYKKVQLRAWANVGDGHEVLADTGSFASLHLKIALAKCQFTLNEDTVFLRIALQKCRLR